MTMSPFHRTWLSDSGTDREAAIRCSTAFDCNCWVDLFDCPNEIVETIYLTYQMNCSVSMHDINEPRHVTLGSHRLDLHRGNDYPSEDAAKLNYSVVLTGNLKRYPPEEVS